MKVLIIKLGALGDIIISTPIIKQILLSHAEDEVYLLTTPGFAGFFSEWSELKIKALPRSGFINTTKQTLWVRQHHFDRIYDLQSNDRSSLLCAISGSPCRVGNHPRFPYHKHPETEYLGQCHSFERLNQVLVAAGLPVANPAPQLPINDDDRNRVVQWLDKHELNNNAYVIMHAGSSPQHPAKRWPHFAELAKEVEKKGYRVIWVGTNDESVLNENLALAAGINATGAFTISELIALGKKAAFAVTNDSAPMHILSCTGIPVFSLFGPTNPRRTHPIGQEQRVIFAGGSIPQDDRDFKPVDITAIQLHEVLNRLSKEKLL